MFSKAELYSHEVLKQVQEKDLDTINTYAAYLLNLPCLKELRSSKVVVNYVHGLESTDSVDFVKAAISISKQ